jgi:hypothetical protein
MASMTSCWFMFAADDEEMNLDNMKHLVRFLAAGWVVISRRSRKETKEKSNPPELVRDDGSTLQWAIWTKSGRRSGLKYKADDATDIRESARRCIRVSRKNSHT